MTRELKLALIVGFALVLLVTVLISDHLSKARKAQLASNITDAPAAVVNDPNQTAPGPVVTITQGTGGGVAVQPPVLVGPGPTDPNAGLVIKDPAKDPSIIASTAVRGGEPVPQVAPLVNTDHASLTNGLRPESMTVSQTPTLDLSGAGGQSPTSPVIGGGTILPGLDVSKQQSGATTDPRPAVVTDPTSTLINDKKTDQPKAPVAEERWHTVASGDSAYSIAKKYYGKGEYWTKLKDANGNRIGAKGQVRVGVRVRIPEPASIGIKGVELPKPSGTTTQLDHNSTKPRETRVAGATGDKPAGPREYTVQKGDTLGLISQKQLGTTKRADEIMKLNKSLKNPNALREGMKLMLPAA